MKRIRRTKVIVEQCRVIATRGAARITESVACPDCGRIFVPGYPIEQIPNCSPPRDRPLLLDAADDADGSDE